MNKRTRKLVGTKKAPITEDSPIRWKATQRAEVMERLRNDIINANLLADEQVYNPHFKGTHRERKETMKRYEKRLWQAMWIMLSLPVIYILAILIIDNI